LSEAADSRLLHSSGGGTGLTLHSLNVRGKALGLVIPQSILVRADRLIE
jgi:hypothetical protein